MRTRVRIGVLAQDARGQLRVRRDRGHGRVLRVARTIADLAGSPRVRATHVNEALGFRQEDAIEGTLAA